MAIMIYSHNKKRKTKKGHGQKGLWPEKNGYLEKT